MSKSPASIAAPAKSSGCWVIACPASDPLNPWPTTPSEAGRVYRSRTRNWAAEMKSSKLVCFAAPSAASRQPRPYSPPPRTFGTATMPPSSSQAANIGEYVGVADSPNAPIPASSVGWRPFSVIPRRAVMNIGMRVPSVLVYKSRVVSYTDRLSDGHSLNGDTARVSRSYRYTVGGCRNDVYVKYSDRSSACGLISVTVPMPGGGTDPRAPP